MAETRNNAGRDDGSSFTKVLNGLTGLKQSVDKSVRRTDDVLRKYNAAKMTEDGEERAAVLSKSKKADSASSVTKKDVAEAVSTANESTAKRLNELFGEVKTASATKVSSQKQTDVGKSADSSKVSTAKTAGMAAIAAVVSGAVATGIAKSQDKKSNGKTKTQERIEELFGEAKDRGNASAARLDELFGQANTKLTGVDKSINEIKEPLLKRLSMNFGEMILKMLMSPVGLLMISFVAGFIKGKIEKFIKDIKDFIPNKIEEFKKTVKGWIEEVKTSVKKFIDDPIGTIKGMISGVTDKVANLIKDPIGTVKGWLEPIKNFFAGAGKAILGGGLIALLLNKLSGGLLGMVTKPLLGLLGKGIGGLLTKGVPMLLKGGLGLGKGLLGMLTNPVGAGIAALAGGIAIGYGGFKMISNKLQEMREEETKKINEKASTFASNEQAKEQNKSELEKLKSGDGDEQYMQVSNGHGGFDMVKGHFDADGNFVIVEKMDEGGTFKAVEPDTAGIQVGDVAKKTKKMSFNWIAQSKKGITRVQFGQIEAPVKRAFMQYVDKNYCQTGELPANTSTKLMGALLEFSAHYSVEGEGLNNDDGEAGLKEQLAKTWVTLNQVVAKYEPGFSQLRQFVDNYKIVYGKIVGYMVPKSNRGAIMAAVSEEKFLFEKNYLQSDDWNHIAFAATVYQIWLDIFLNFMNQEFKTDFRSNTITKAEYDEAMGNEKGVQSQALALSTSLATQVRTDNADKAKREAVKIAAAKKKAEAAKKSGGPVQKIANPDGTFSYRHSDGTEASKEEIDAYNEEHFEENKTPASPFSQTVTRDDIDRLFDEMSEIKNNSKQAADNSKRAEQAGTAAAVTSAISAKNGRSSGHSADGNKVKPTGNR